MLVETYGSLNTPQPEVNEALKKEIEGILQEPIGRGDHFFSDMAENLIHVPSDITDDVIDTYMIKKLEYLEWAKGLRELNTDEVAQYECMSENITKATENEKKEVAEYKQKIIRRDKEIALKAQVKLWSNLEVSTPLVKQCRAGSFGSDKCPAKAAVAPLILSRASSSNSRNQNSLISTERKHAFSGIETDDLRAIQNNHHYNILQSFLSSLEASLHLARTKALVRREKKPELLEQLKTVVKILFSPEYRMKVSYHFSFNDNVLERFKKDKYLKSLEKHLVIFEKLDILSESEFKELLLSISKENLTNQDKRNFMSFYKKKKGIAENLKRAPRPVVGATTFNMDERY
jgi:hypothetical protein